MLNIYSSLKYLILICGAGAVINSCNVINPHERVPTYVHIDSFHFTDPVSHEITGVQAYYNNNPIGNFDLPVTIPIMATGSGKLLLYPVIASNGQNDVVTPYYFYEGDTSTIVAQPGQIINYTPKTKYASTAKSFTISDFEYGQVKLLKCGGTVGIVGVIDPALVYQGNGSGGIFLNAVGDSSIDSSASFDITDGPSYIEFDYQCTVPFALGMQSDLSTGLSTGQYYLAGASASPNKWRKFYLNLTGFTSTYNSDKYTFFIKTSLPADATPGKRVLIDNIKLISN